MNKNLTKTSQAKALHELAKIKSESGDFAYRLAARSFESHLDEIKMPKPPRDRVFLAMCGWPWLVVCHYNKYDDDFVTANLMIDVDGSVYFENEWLKEDEITGWVEMP